MTWTPLHEAVVMGDVAALNAALAATIFPDPRDRHGQTPLHFAAHLGNVEAVSALLLAGASPNAREDPASLGSTLRSLWVFRTRRGGSGCAGRWAPLDVRSRH
ncbi:TPA: ankyrin repeat domain-containing protein [Stenotrophomonas maltophilia]